MNDSRKWWYLAALVGGGWLLYLLAPVLTPFALSALLAYIGDPIVDRLEARKVKRTLAVVIVFVALTSAALLLLIILAPLLYQQIASLVRKLPDYIDWVQRDLFPFVSQNLGLEQDRLELAALRDAVAKHWQQAGGVLMGFVTKISKSGVALAAWVANLVLIPVVTFYMLRDWDVMMARIRNLLPRSVEPRVVQLAGECDEVLGAFFRGQLLVMGALGAIYTTGLLIVGLDLALLIGLTAGLVSFVPYMGFIVGIVAAVTATLFQFQDFLHIVYVAIIFGVGQALEGMVLTPLLVGDRIGLHPVAVIFAVLAGGQLFGFLGVLMALPAAAVIAVLVRHARDDYLGSGFYRS